PIVAVPIAWQPAPPGLLDVPQGNADGAAMSKTVNPAPTLCGGPEAESPTADERAANILPTEPRGTSTAVVPNQLPWRAGVFWLWIAGSALWFSWTGVRLLRVRRLLAYARCAPAAVQARGRQLAQRMGMRDSPGIWLLPGTVSPMLWALFGRPRLL